MGIWKFGNEAGEVLAPLLTDNELGQFDVAHARFVLEHLPDPLLLVRNMAGAVRPGGRVILSDDDYDGLRLWPSHRDLPHYGVPISEPTTDTAMIHSSDVALFNCCIRPTCVHDVSHLSFLADAPASLTLRQLCGTLRASSMKRWTISSLSDCLANPSLRRSTP